MNAIPLNPLASAWRARSDDVGRRQPHLRQEQIPLGHSRPPYGASTTPPRLTSVALVYYFYYVRGLMDVGLNSESTGAARQRA